MILQGLSQIWPVIILSIAVANAAAWCYLVAKSRRLKQELAEHLLNLVRSFSHQRSDGELTATIDERIDSFIADISDVLQNSQDSDKRGELSRRLKIKDESRPYLKTHRFEVAYNVSRSLIEIYPLLGIVGTVFAIWAGLSTSAASDSDKIAIVVENFGVSVQSTAWGLLAAIVFSVLNSFLEPGFERLFQYGERVRQLVSGAKQKLSLEALPGNDHEHQTASS